MLFFLLYLGVLFHCPFYLPSVLHFLFSVLACCVTALCS
jgi:hypothetical protein